GDRNISYSLKGCVACHAVMGPDALPISSDNGQYFCRVCHDYVAVKIGCFQCHNSLPDPKIRALLVPEEPDLAALSDYLDRVTQ
ncbi:MAG: hypothetical protein ACC619_10080, partial [Paracoccaceae bacterium]